MVSKYKAIRHSKQAQNPSHVRAMGPRTYGYDYANDGWRNIVDYNKIRKLLRSKIGQNWNKVYSDLCNKYDRRTYVGRETLEYIDYLITPRSYKWLYDDFYVDESGILRYKAGERYSGRSWKNRLGLIELDGNHYIKWNNIWYQVEVQDVSSLKPGWGKLYSCCDIFLGSFSEKYLHWITYKLVEYYGKSVCCLSKRQVAKPMCKKLNAIAEKDV